MSRFCGALVQLPGVSSEHCREGLRALKSAHRSVIHCDASSRVTGSADLDEALKPRCPQDPRWDYGIGFEHQGREVAIWVEVHSAGNAEDVRAVIEKAEWLKAQLARVTQLQQMTRRPFVWVASGRNTLTKSGKALRLAAQNADLVDGPVNRVNIP